MVKYVYFNLPYSLVLFKLPCTVWWKLYYNSSVCMPLQDIIQSVGKLLNWKMLYKFYIKLLSARLTLPFVSWFYSCPSLDLGGVLDFERVSSVLKVCMCKYVLVFTVGINKEELRPYQTPTSQKLEAERARKGQRRHGYRWWKVQYLPWSFSVPST